MRRRAGRGCPPKKSKGSGSGQKIDDLPNGKIRFGALYGAGARLQLTPQQINAMSMWQFFAMLDGLADSGDGLTAQEADELWEFIHGD